MPASHPHSISTSRFGPYADFVAPAADAEMLSLDPGERVGGPVARRRARILLPLLLIAAGAAGAWSWHAHRDDITQASSALAGLMRSPAPGPEPLQHAAPATPEKPEALPELGPDKVLEPVHGGDGLPAQEAAAQHLEQPAAADPPVEDKADDPEPAVDKLPPVKADPGDALQQRALAAGLHPGLSRALLERLTAADFRNAKHAVSSALAQRSETRIFMWPKQRESDLALFTVKFVAGAPRDCRRYVVVILKDRWQTTARPMERCGPLRNHAKAS